jgi:hypothetical protein
MQIFLQAGMLNVGNNVAGGVNQLLSNMFTEVNMIIAPGILVVDV